MSYSILKEFPEITSAIGETIRTLVSTQYHELNGWKQIRLAVGEIFKKKRASFLALTDQHLVQIQTLGKTVIEIKKFALNDIEKIKFASEKAPNLKDAYFPTATIELKADKKGLKESLHYILFPSLFISNNTDKHNMAALMQMVEMRKDLLARLEKVQINICEKLIKA